jgi:hypothetical protein
MTGNEAQLTTELSEAGVAVDRLIENLLSRGLSPMAVASACLGGSLGLLARTMGDEAIIQILHNAQAGVRAGDLRSGRG